MLSKQILSPSPHDSVAPLKNLKCPHQNSTTSRNVGTLYNPEFESFLLHINGSNGLVLLYGQHSEFSMNGGSRNRKPAINIKLLCCEKYFCLLSITWSDFWKVGWQTSRQLVCSDMSKPKLSENKAVLTEFHVATGHFARKPHFNEMIFSGVGAGIC